METSQMKSMTTVIVPTKNEAGGIYGLVLSLKDYADEIIVVDGNSKDGTREEAERAGAVVVLDNGKGKGDAYKVGIQAASREVIVFIDADGSHEPADIPKIVRPILEGRAELVIASRHKGGSDEWKGDVDTWIRAFGSDFLSVMINLKWKSDLTDVLNGFRAAKTDVAKNIPINADDFDVEQHMIVQFLKYGHRVTEVGSHESCRKWGESKLPTFRKAYLFFWRLFTDYVCGPYRRPVHNHHVSSERLAETETKSARD